MIAGFRLAVALVLVVPFLFFFTQAPLTNFWPLMCTWLCAGVAALAWFGLKRASPMAAPGKHAAMCVLPAALLLASLLASAIGLLQYFGVADVVGDCKNWGQTPIQTEIGFKPWARL